MAGLDVPVTGGDAITAAGWADCPSGCGCAFGSGTKAVKPGLTYL